MAHEKIMISDKVARVLNADWIKKGEFKNVGVEASIGTDLYDSFCRHKDRIPREDWLVLWAESRGMNDSDDELEEMINLYIGLDEIDPEEDS